MAVTAKLYGRFALNTLNGVLKLESNTIKAMLCTSSYSPNQDTHEFRSHVTNEVSAPGYTAGGAILTGKSLVYNASQKRVTFSASSVEWNAAITARYLVIYDDTAPNKPLIGYVDFGEDKSSQSGGTFRVTWPSHVLQVTVS